MNQFITCALELNNKLPAGHYAQLDILNNESVNAKRIVSVFSQSGEQLLILEKRSFRFVGDIQSNPIFVEWFENNWKELWIQVQKLPNR